MKFKRYIALSILLQYLLPFTLSGVVYDENNNFISNALIQIEKEDVEILSDGEGEFIIKDLVENFYKIKISHIGYKNYIKDLNLNEESYLKVILKQTSMNLDRVVVTGTRSPRHIKETPVLTHVIGPEDINNSSYSNVKDILEITMPNVQMVESNHGNDRVKIQGLDNKYLTFLIDGDRVSGEYAGNIDFSMFGLSDVEKIEVIEGAMSTLYGSSAMGGVINIITKKNKKPYWFNSTMQYDDPVVRLMSMNSGFNKGIINYNLNIHYTESDGYDLTPNTIDSKTLDENKTKILSHRLMLFPSDGHNIQLMYKDYNSMINKYINHSTWGLVFDSPLNRYDDYYFKMKYDYKISNNREFKISYLKEKYIKKTYYPYYYNPDDYIINGSQFKNGILDREEINFQYLAKEEKYNILIGLEVYDENYSSFNIYDSGGDILQSSIFNGQDLTETDKDVSLYFYEERKLNNNNILSYGLRMLNEESILLPSLSYLLKGNDDYNYRFSYSSGYRKPSIKELYYQWLDHAGPEIHGDPDLNPSQNNYFSISIDKRTSINDFSVNFYRNDIDNMISTEYITESDSEDYGELHYKNYDEVLIYGVNVHYYRKITDKIKLKFVYNLTNASSESNEILEGISKHAFRLNLYCKLLNNLDIIANIKYVGEKNVFDQEQDFVGGFPVIELPAYSLSDLYLIASFNKTKLKVGVKNIFDYKDPAKSSSEVLNNYDPGRRFFVEFSMKFEGDNNEE